MKWSLFGIDTGERVPDPSIDVSPWPIKCQSQIDLYQLKGLIHNHMVQTGEVCCEVLFFQAT